MDNKLVEKVVVGFATQTGLALKDIKAVERPSGLRITAQLETTTGVPLGQIELCKDDGIWIVGSAPCSALVHLIINLA
jgi:hypothetical protein